MPPPDVPATLSVMMLLTSRAESPPNRAPTVPPWMLLLTRVTVLPSAGTYFLNVDIGPLGQSDDVAFCQRLVAEHGVAAIPVSAFYAEGAVRNVVRFCFAKHDATLDKALERLAALRVKG